MKEQARYEFDVKAPRGVAALQTRLGDTCQNCYGFELAPGIFGPVATVFAFDVGSDNQLKYLLHEIEIMVDQMSDILVDISGVSRIGRPERGIGVQLTSASFGSMTSCLYGHLDAMEIAHPVECAGPIDLFMHRSHWSPNRDLVYDLGSTLSWYAPLGPDAVTEVLLVDREQRRRVATWRLHS